MLTSKFVTLFSGDGNRVGALSAARLAIQQNSGDVSFLFIGDSTGVGTTRWIYRFSQWLATEYPTHSVSYRTWDNTSDVYAAESVLGTGSGANTIRIWNASVSGSNTELLMGTKYAAAIAAVDPDCIVWNHGHNMTGLLDWVLRGRFIGPMENVRQTFPTVPHAMVVQNPTRDDNVYEQISNAIRSVAATRTDTTILDVFTKFVKQGKASSLYSDNVHQSATGDDIYLNVAKDEWRRSIVMTYDSLPAWLSTNGTNILTNGDFSAFAGATPDEWTAVGNGTISKELVIVDGDSPYSVKMVNGSTATSIFQAPLTTAYRNKYLTLAVRGYFVAGGNSNTGRVYLYLSKGPIAIVNVGDIGVDGWKWIVIHNVLVASDEVQIGVYLYSNPTAGFASTVYWDRAILVEGNVPKNMA